MAILILLTVLLLSEFSHSKYRRWINPITIFVVPHSLSILLLLGANFIDGNLSSRTFIIFFSSIILYCLGTEIGASVDKSFRKDKKKIKIIKPIKVQIKPFLFVASIVIDIIIVLYIREIQQNYGIINAILNLSKYNQYLQQEGAGSGYSVLVFLAMPFSLILQVCIRYVQEIKENTLLKIVLMIQFVVCFIPFISARRNTIVFLAILNLLLYYLSSTRKLIHNYKRILLGAGVIYFILLFFSKTQQMMNKSTSIIMTCYGVTVPKALVDIFGYLAGNYKYFDLVMQQGLPKVDAPLIATLRVPYIYIGGLFKSTVNTTDAFALRLMQIGDNGVAYHFNTIPIQYYLMLDSVYLFPFEMIMMGAITSKMYKKTMSDPTISNLSLCAFQFAVVFMSFREYDLIFLSSIVTLFILLFLKKISFTRGIYSLTNKNVKKMQLFSKQIPRI